MDSIISAINLNQFFNSIINTDNHTLKGEFGKDIEEYCRQHSKDGDGKNEDFSRVPFECSYEIAVDVVDKTIEHIKKELKKWE